MLTTTGDRLRRAWLFALLLLGASRTLGSVDSLIEAVQNSEFRFARTQSDVPFPPAGWLEVRYTPRTEFKSSSGEIAPGSFVETAFSQGVIGPVYVSQRDMLLLGENVFLEKADVQTGPYSDQRVLAVVPMAAWLRQIDRNNLGGAFIAPQFSRELNHDDSWGAQAYCGVIIIHWKTDTLQWVYGAVYEYSFGRNYIYPYLGALWLPNPKVSLSLTFPWPTLSYVPRDPFMLSIGLTPGGASWVSDRGGAKAVYSLNSWNLTANLAWRFYGRLWLQAGVGRSGLRSVKITTGSGDNVIETHSKTVYKLSVQFRI
jgi:hypothetical protein